jgi:hypothetical protein
VGQSGDYAFSMNSFHLASVLAPMVKYDVRYADSIGKYLLNLVNNAKVFFPQTLPLSRQSMNNYLQFDKSGSLAYEGFRNSYANVFGIAMGDATTMFNQPSDLSIYSSAFIGALGGITKETNVKGILQIDLNATDSFGRNTYDNYLFYNPYAQDQVIRFDGSVERYDLFDAVTKRIVARNVSGSVNVTVPAEASKLLVVLPANSQYIISGNNITVNDFVIAQFQIGVSIINLSSRQELTSDSDIIIQYSSPRFDEISEMKIYFGETLVYSGAAITLFRYDKSKLPNTDYTLKVVVQSESGKIDVASKRVIAR